MSWSKDDYLNAEGRHPAGTAAGSAPPRRLYSYGLNVVPLHVPPLRQRQEDVLALAPVFLARMTPEGSHAPELGSDAVVGLMAHSWPRNVRELRNVIERALAYTPIPSVLRAEHLCIAAN